MTHREREPGAAPEGSELPEPHDDGCTCGLHFGQRFGLDALVARIAPELAPARRRAELALRMFSALSKENAEYVDTDSVFMTPDQGEKAMHTFLAGAVLCLDFIPGSEADKGKLLNVALAMALFHDGPKPDDEAASPTEPKP